MKIKIIPIILITPLITGCFSMGSGDIRKYQKKSTTSLDVPMDLTIPNPNTSFRIKNHARDVSEELIYFTDTPPQHQLPYSTSPNVPTTKINVEKSGGSLSLIVNHPPNKLWALSRSFLSNKGLAINTTNKLPDLMTMETKYAAQGDNKKPSMLGNIGDSLLGVFTNKKRIDQVDKYRITIEPITGSTSSRLYLSLSSMVQVTSTPDSLDGQLIWQAGKKDSPLELAMLQSLMVYLGDNLIEAKEKIKLAISSNPESHPMILSIDDGKLTVKKSYRELWPSLLWSLDQMDIGIKDHNINTGMIQLESSQPPGSTGWDIFAWTHSSADGYSLKIRKVSGSVTSVSIHNTDNKNKFIKQLTKNIISSF